MHTLHQERKNRKLPDEELSRLLSAMYYAPGGFQGAQALKDRLTTENLVTERINNWLHSQELFQRHLGSKPAKPQFARFDVTVPNELHQADLLMLPNDNG